jgi:hypothetical protein
MIMGKLRKFLIGVAATAGLAAAAAPAGAQIVAGTCGVSVPQTAAAIFYDPFNPTPVSGFATTLTVDSFVGGHGGEKTQQANFYFTEPAGSPAFQILCGTQTDSSVTCANGDNILYATGSPTPTLSVLPPPQPGSVFMAFGGSVTTLPLAVSVTLPAGLDIASGTEIAFGVTFVCHGTGNPDFVDVAPPGESIPDVIILPVVVLDALQAHFAGPSPVGGNGTNFDFGDITTVTLAQAPSHVLNGNIDVKSSGPYEVNMTSGNHYLLNAGGVTNIPYSATLLGRTRDFANQTFSGSTVSCLRAGVTTGVQLPISVALEDGGSGKTPGTYDDTLTVTLTPFNGAPGAVSCP